MSAEQQRDIDLIVAYTGQKRNLLAQFCQGYAGVGHRAASADDGLADIDQSAGREDLLDGHFSAAGKFRNNVQTQVSGHDQINVSLLFC